MNDVVWLTGTYPWAGDEVSGFFFRTQAQAVARTGTSIAVVAPAPAVPWPLHHLSERWRRYARAPSAAMDGQVTVVRPRYVAVPGQPSWAVPDRSMAAAAWRARRTWLGARVIHGHFAVAGMAAWRLAGRAGLPFVLTFHGSDLNTWPDEHPERLMDLRAAVSQARAVFAVSPPLAERVRALSGADAIVLPIGCDHAALARDALPRATARRVLGLPESSLVVLFVGAIKTAKGVRELAEAVDALGEPFTGVFVGPAERGTPVQGVSNRVAFVGPRPHADVVRYMSAADVLVLPSHREGLPTVLVEAGSLGLPVIASRVGGIPALLGPDRGTLLTEVSPAAIVAALRAFEADRPTAHAAAERLRVYVHAEHDVDRNAGRLVETYRSIAGTTPTSTWGTSSGPLP